MSIQEEYVLFKYCTPERMDIIQNCKIRFTQPICFNDLYECIPVIEGGFDSLQVSAEEKNRIYDEFQSSIALAIMDDQPAGKAMLAENMLIHARQVYQDMVLILCLSATNDNILMWSHYAREGEGFLIAFKHNKFGVPLKSGKLANGFPVTYQQEKPVADLMKTVSLNLDLPEIQKWFYTKYTAWQYEQEWRIVANKHLGFERIDVEPYPIYLHSFDPDCISYVILGPRMRHDDENKLVTLCEEKNIRYYKAVKSLASYNLHIWDSDTYKRKVAAFSGKIDIALRKT